MGRRRISRTALSELSPDGRQRRGQSVGSFLLQKENPRTLFSAHSFQRFTDQAQNGMGERDGRWDVV
eukprot:4085093-Pyramimonas_sp.AAC.1